MSTQERETRDLAEALGTLAAGEPPALEVFLPALQRLLSAEEVVAFGLAFGPEGASLSFLHGSPGLLARGRLPLQLVLREHPRDFGAFDPLRPDPAQRNAPLTRRELAALADLSSLPAVRQVLPACGLAEHDLLRVLVCDGTELLAWVGAFRPEPFGLEAQRALRTLVPPLRQRLTVERQLAGAPVTAAALAAALEAVGAPAFVLRDRGQVLHANASGRALLEADIGAIAAELRATLRDGHSRGSRYAVTRLEAPGIAHHYLVLQRTPPASAALRAASAAVRWSLTPRQREVLALLASGASNKSVAAALGCAERTVELHVTALLEKTGCGHRAQLVAKFWTQG